MKSIHTQPKMTNSSVRPHSLSNNQINGKYELILNWYRITGKNLAGEEVLSNLEIKKLLTELGDPMWNHIYHCWAIEPKHMSHLQPFIKHQFNTEKFSYFIEAFNN